MADSRAGLFSYTYYYAHKTFSKVLAKKSDLLVFMETALIITTYNWPEALKITLESILAQSTKPNQIIVADDGSGPGTAEVVKETLMSSGINWCHVRHEDKGVRQSRIKNLAVKKTDCDYLIFIDQDVVAHPRFIEDHLTMSQKDFFLQGKRVLLSQRYTNSVIEKKKFEIPLFFSTGIKNRKNSIRSRILSKIFSKTKKFETSLRGCNLSMFREDYMQVDGFDEIYDQSWGREDSDICYRLFHSGIKVKILWFTALQYHLKHAVITDWDRNRLDKSLLDTLNEKRIKALKGFSQLSPEGKVVGSSG